MIAHLDPIASRPSTPLAGLETLCADFEEQSAKLESLIALLEADLDAVKNKHLAGLKRQAAVVARRQAELESAIEAQPGLFVKPRSFTLHGVKVGLTATDGKLVFDDVETVLKLIRKFHKEDSATFIRIKEEPNKDALWTLSVGELARLGCRIEGAGDVVICKRMAGDVERLIKNLITKLVEVMVQQD